MLRYLREQSGSWIIKIILGLIIIIFAFFFGIGGFGPKNHGPVAKVNNKPITFGEYKESYESMVQQIRARLGENYDEKVLEKFNVKKAALDRLIDERLVFIASEKLDIKVIGKEISSFINDHPYFKINGKFNFDKYKRVLASNSMTPEMYEASQRRLFIQQKMKNFLFDNVIVSDLELLEWQKYFNSKLKINYFKFDPAQYKDIKPGKEELKDYYTKHKDKYKTPARRKVEYLKFSSEDYKNNIDVAQKDMKQYYEENSALYSVPEKVEARHILIKTAENADENAIEKARKQAMKIYKLAIDKKNDFAELAKKYSQGPSSKNGGDLGSFSAKEMVKPFATAAFSMKPGEISKPVKTRFGWHIIQLIAKHKPATKTFEQVKSEIKKIILAKKISDRAYYDAGDAFDAVVDGDSLNQAGLLTNRKVIKAGPFSKDGTGLGLRNPEQFVKAAFSTMLNEISNIIEIDNSYYLIKPIKEIAPEVIKFENVQERVKTDLISEMQKEKAEKSADNVLALTKKGKTLTQIAKSAKLKLNDTKFFDRQGYIPEIGYAKDISKASFKLTKKDEVYPEKIKFENSFYIISLKEKSVPKGFKDDKDKAELKKSLENQKKERMFAAWIDSLKSANKVEILMPELFK